MAVAAFPAEPRRLPDLDDVVEVAAGRYRLGEPGEEREVDLGAVLVGRYPVTNAQLGAFVEATGERRRRRGPAGSRSALADHPATGLTFAEAEGVLRVGDGGTGTPGAATHGGEWEAAARGPRRPPWPWGHTFDPERCAAPRAGPAGPCRWRRTPRARAAAAPSSSPGTCGSGSPTRPSRAGAPCAAARTSTTSGGCG